MTDVLAIILGGGQGKRLYPLTYRRSKPAVPIGGKYRLIDIPISNCLHAGIRRIFVLTQFNSASLNRHVGQTYRLDHFSQSFVDIIAAEQTPENTNWFQGTADAVRRAMPHFIGLHADHYLILAGDHLYRMDFDEMMRSHVASGADITIAAQPANADDARGMGIFRFDRKGQIDGFEEKPSAARLQEMGGSLPAHAQGDFTTPADKPFVASMGIYVFTRKALIEALAEANVVGDRAAGTRDPGPGARDSGAGVSTAAAPRTSEFAAMRNQEDAPPCSTCGSIMIRSGSCYKCANCGTTSGCA